MRGPPEANETVRALSIPPDALFDVRGFGASGEGKRIESGAINRAIAAARRDGGGTVWLPRGTYASYSIRLGSRVRIYLDPGAVILAAEPPEDASDTEGYDPAEESIAARFPYQDFGHSHWRNSLMWGENLRDVAIEGEGLIWGRGLVNGDFEPGRLPAARPGVGNKAIALVGCENVVLKDLSIRDGGHCAVLATGTKNVRAENLRIDTNRDGLNFDCCEGVRVIGCTINSPNDDAISLKSTYALGKPVLTRDVLIRDCVLTGAYRPGTVMDGTYRRLGNDAQTIAEHYTCRIKLGTESNGGFQDILVRSNVMRGCRGIAIITVDGGVVAGVSVETLAMYDVRGAPIFIRLGARLNGPKGTVPGRLRDVRISDVHCEQLYTSMPMIVSGIPGHPIEDVEMRHVHMRMRGGGTARMAAILPPEAVRSYPEPSGHIQCFGPALPASGLFVRHVKGFEVSKFTLECIRPDRRPAVWLRDFARGTIRVARARGVRVPGVRIPGPGEARHG